MHFPFIFCKYVLKQFMLQKAQTVVVIYSTYSAYIVTYSTFKMRKYGFIR